jgi:hypothetical protein
MIDSAKKMSRQGRAEKIRKICAEPAGWAQTRSLFRQCRSLASIRTGYMQPIAPPALSYRCAHCQLCKYGP